MRIVLGATLALALLGAGAGTATAAAPEPFEVECNGVTYEVTTGNGNWSAAVATDHSTRFIPYAFDFKAFDSEGNLVFEGSETKGNGKAHQNQSGKLTCTFSETFEEDGETFSFTGTAEVVQR